jgi:subtilase family serine protease
MKKLTITTLIITSLALAACGGGGSNPPGPPPSTPTPIPTATPTPAGTYTVGASYPASDPYGTGVGGTETNMGTFTLTSTTVWNDNSCSGTPHQCAGGGGVSTLFPLPSYQTGIAGEASATYRNVPDVSMPAEDVSVYEGGWAQFNGTSWASPEYAALMADLFQYCKATSGIANPYLIPYYVAGNNYLNAFIDVTKGTDQYQGTTPFYAAAVGYDDASGWGVPSNGFTYANTVCPGRVPVNPLIAPREAFSARRVASYTVNVTPRVAGIIDIGERGTSEPTRVQFVLNNTPSIASDEARLTVALQQAGFTIVQRFSNHLIVDAVAPSKTVERYFSTRMHNVQQQEYGIKYMPATPVTIPASIAQYVQVVNMDNVVTRKSMLRRLSSSLATMNRIAQASCTQSNGGLQSAGWGPDAIQKSLNIPFSSATLPTAYTPNATYNGSGQTVAVVIDSNVNPADISAYETAYSVTPAPTPTDEPVDGAGNGCVSGEQDEATLDVETIAGLAPGANIIIYQVPSLSDQYIADAYNQVVTDGQAHVVNSSIGGCENPPPVATNTPEDAVIKAAAPSGFAFISSAGDQGNVCG